MGRRRKSRETALQFLYQLDLASNEDPAGAEAEFWARAGLDPETQSFAGEIVRGTKHHQGKIDDIISGFTENWHIDRMSAVDRNLLRASVYELLWHPDVPTKVVINEAIEIAKKFGTSESSRFINGILDRVARELRPPL